MQYIYLLFSTYTTMHRQKKKQGSHQDPVLASFCTPGELKLNVDDVRDKNGDVEFVQVTSLTDFCI